MENNYQYAYADQTPYGNAWNLMQKLNQPAGVHLDLGCGYGAISEKISSAYTYVGIDGDEDAVEFLKGKGLEAYHHVFGNKDKDIEFIRFVLNGRPLSQITLLDILEHLSSPDTILDTLHDILLENNAPLIVSVPNVSHRDISLKLLSGDFDYTETGLLDKTHLSLYTEKRLTEVFENSGFFQIGQNDFHLGESDQHFPNDHIFLSESTLAGSYLHALKAQADSYNTVNQFIRSFFPSRTGHAIATCEEQKPNPFLSVIMRTQGKRPEALDEALLCLVAQTNRDFELLLMAHKVDSDTLSLLHSAIEKTPIWLQRQTRIITVDYGNRTTPLTEGVIASRGKYFAMFDDDDIVFDHWVDTFFKLFKANSGCVLHAYAVTQEWEVIKQEDGPSQLRACSTFDNIYCQDYSFLAQLTNNYCPIMSLAFPAQAYKSLGIHFDESLSTTEDWDFLLRTAAVCGVADSSEVTSIYRLWKNTGNAHTQHSAMEWRRNYDLIQNKIKNRHMLLSPDGVGHLLDMLTNYHAVTTADPNYTPAPVYSLYPSYGEGFLEEDRIITPANLSISDMQLYFMDFHKSKLIDAIRFDPSEKQGVFVNDLEISVLFEDDRTEVYTLDDATTNGVRYKDGVAFVFPDPQITISFNKPSVVIGIEVKGSISTKVSDDIYQAVNNAFQSSVLAKSEKGLALLPANFFDQQFSLYVDTGGGYCEENRLCTRADLLDENISVNFEDIDKLGVAQVLRFDPTENAGLIIDSFTAVLTYSDGSESLADLGEISSNGAVYNDSIVFPEHDPQISIPITHESSVTSVRVNLTCRSI